MLKTPGDAGVLIVGLLAIVFLCAVGFGLVRLTESTPEEKAAIDKCLSYTVNQYKAGEVELRCEREFNGTLYFVK